MNLQDTFLFMLKTIHERSNLISYLFNEVVIKATVKEIIDLIGAAINNVAAEDLGSIRSGPI